MLPVLYITVAYGDCQSIRPFSWLANWAWNFAAESSRSDSPVTQREADALSKPTPVGLPLTERRVSTRTRMHVLSSNLHDPPCATTQHLMPLIHASYISRSVMSLSERLVIPVLRHWYLLDVTRRVRLSVFLLSLYSLRAVVGNAETSYVVA